MDFSEIMILTLKILYIILYFELIISYPFGYLLLRFLIFL